MILSKQDELAGACAALAEEPFFTIDTEFLRDKTYYPRLCLIQVAPPAGEPVAIDPLAPGLDLAPLLDLMANKKVLKVFHAARQDLEIFYNLMNEVPAPLFDTQVAAMVCGYGDSTGYHTLVQDACGLSLDKGAQFTDWSRRPLSSRQISYALDDVDHLRAVYKKLNGELEASKRVSWLEEEMGILANPATYENDPRTAWKRIKIKTDKPKILAVLREIAAWRELQAQERDVPRNRIVRDEVLADIALHPPRTVEELGRIRGVGADMAKGRMGRALLDAIKAGLDGPHDVPRPERRERFPSELTPTLEMLKMLLRIQCSESGVAPKMVADTDDLEILAMDRGQADIPALKGWRHDVFGREALALLGGEIVLGLKDGRIFKSRAGGKS